MIFQYSMSKPLAFILCIILMLVKKYDCAVCQTVCAQYLSKLVKLLIGYKVKTIIFYSRISVAVGRYYLQGLHHSGQ